MIEKIWRSMKSAPFDASWVEVILASGEVHRSHWACGDGDGLMPPFEGWFVQVGEGVSRYFRGIPDPIGWRREDDLVQRLLF